MISSQKKTQINQIQAILHSHQVKFIGFTNRLQGGATHLPIDMILKQVLLDEFNNATTPNIGIEYLGVVLSTIRYAA